MNDKFLVEYKESFFRKIINVFKKYFFKTKKEKYANEIQQIKEINQQSKSELEWLELKRKLYNREINLEDLTLEEKFKIKDMYRDEILAQNALIKQLKKA